MSDSNKSSAAMFVKPVDGVRVRDPGHNFAYVPEQGANVPRSNYWLRRIAEGSVAEAKAPKTKKAAAVASKEDK